MMLGIDNANIVTKNAMVNALVLAQQIVQHANMLKTAHIVSKSVPYQSTMMAANANHVMRTASTAALDRSIDSGKAGVIHVRRPSSPCMIQTLLNNVSRQMSHAQMDFIMSISAHKRKGHSRP